MQRRYFLKLSAAGAASLLWSGERTRSAPLASAGPADASPRLRVLRPEAFSAFDRVGTTYEIQPFGGRIVERGPLGVAVREFGSFGVERDQLNHPVALAFGPDNQVYVADHGNSRIQVFDGGGTHLRQISGLNNPRDLAFDAQGRLWVADTLNHQLAVFERDGTLVERIGELGAGPGQFNAPYSLAFAPSGELHVLDYGNRRVSVFDRAGGYRGSYGERRIHSGRSLAVDLNGCAYVADSRSGAIEVFGPGGSHYQPLLPCFPDGSAAVPVQLAFAPAGDLHIAALSGPQRKRQLT